MLKKILLGLGLIALSACSDSKSTIEEKTTTSESEIMDSKIDSKEENTYEKINIEPKDSSIPKLNNFIDINSKDKKKSLVYWYIANTNHNLDINDYFKIFSPEILVKENSFEREKMIEQFKINLPNYEKHVNYYSGLKYFSIPFDSSNESIDENDISAEMLSIYEYDHEKGGFKNICVRDYSTGSFFSKREELTNTYIKFINKTNRANSDVLCFFPLPDNKKAEELYNLFTDGKATIWGRAYVKLSSVDDIENKNSEYYFDPSNSIFIETVALDLKILKEFDGDGNYIKNINDRPVLYHVVVGSPQYFN
ncbi:hypothetical protein [Acinetobacter guillouiae]|uniref:hypothetical protein n=1 Tax=Acinetobacter guillouiae TaxID=106649 RepID=UPI003AF6BAD1